MWGSNHQFCWKVEPYAMKKLKFEHSLASSLLNIICYQICYQWVWTSHQKTLGVAYFDPKSIYNIFSPIFVQENMKKRAQKWLIVHYWRFFFLYCPELPIWFKIEKPCWKWDWGTFFCYIYSVAMTNIFTVHLRVWLESQPYDQSVIINSFTFSRDSFNRCRRSTPLECHWVIRSYFTLMSRNQSTLIFSKAKNIYLL